MSQKRGGFQLDAMTMGTARRDSEDTSNNAAKERPSTSAPFTPHSDGQLPDHGLECEADGGASMHSQCKASMETISTEYYRSRLQQLRENAGNCADATLMNFELNNIFIKRLDQIDILDKQSGGDIGSPQLRLVTFQEWVDLLLDVNNLIFGNMSGLEEEVYAKIMDCFQSVRGEQQQALDENRKLRKDMCSIIKLVQTAYHKNCWDTSDICLETLTVNQLLGIPRDQCLPESECEKVAKCMTSLAAEVAAKHDEACHLLTQIAALDEVVQTARQKIILKDECIAQLNQQLLELNECIVNMRQCVLGDGECQAPTNDCPNNPSDCRPPCSEGPSQFERNVKCAFQSLRESEKQESEMLQVLNTELQEVFTLHDQCKYQAMEQHKQRLERMFEQLNLERGDMMQKLRHIRCQLQGLEENVDQMPPAAIGREDCANDEDFLLIEALRRRLVSMNQCNQELHSKYQRMECQNNVKLTEMKSKRESDRRMNKRNCIILKEIADLICKLTCSHFSYENIYSETCNENPFCLAIMEMFDNQDGNSGDQAQLIACNERLEHEIKCLNETVQDREKQIVQLNSMINGYSDFCENKRLNDEIHELKQLNCDQSRKIREMAAMLKCQEDDRVELKNKYEKLMCSLGEQCKDLNIAHRRAKCLQGRLDQVEKLQDELKIERNLLREEIIALKEKEACMAGRERSLCEQLKCSYQEAERLRTFVRNMQCHMAQAESQHRDAVRQLECANEEIGQQMRDIACECKQMQQKLRQQTDVNQQQQQIIDSFRKWKDAQLRSDEAMRLCMKSAEEYISLLLAENQRLCEEYRKMHRDHCLLEEEVQCVRSCVNRNPSANLSGGMDGAVDPTTSQNACNDVSGTTDSYQPPMNNNPSAYYSYPEQTQQFDQEQTSSQFQ